MAAAAVRGTIAAMAMTGVRRVSVGVGLVEATPPERLVEDGAPEFAAGMPPDRRAATVELVHWATGALAGALFGLLPQRTRQRRAAGALYGLAILALFETVVEPALRVQRPARPRLRERLAIAADHVLYGLIVAERR